MRPQDRTKSLQQVLRERREAKPLLTVEQLRRRELERERQAAETAAAAAVEAWRTTGEAVDSAGRLGTGDYRTIFALDPDAYGASRHWIRRVRAQLEAARACEVAACREPEDVRVLLLDRARVGEERVGSDLITLCLACERRARRLERESGRLPRREELVALDPRTPLYDENRIAALRSRYSRPLRRKDVRP
jgi:hypothetical protein